MKKTHNSDSDVREIILLILELWKDQRMGQGGVDAGPSSPAVAVIASFPLAANSSNLVSFLPITCDCLPLAESHCRIPGGPKGLKL